MTVGSGGTGSITLAHPTGQITHALFEFNTPVVADRLLNTWVPTTRLWVGTNDPANHNTPSVHS